MADHAKVLVVDDEEVVGRSFDRVLGERGYEVTTARNGEEALRKLDSNGFDLVFTDIKMPGMDGIEVAKRVKEMNPWLPVVIVTGYGSSENEARAQEAGVSQFLHKPLSPEIIEWVTKKSLAQAAAGPAVVTAPVKEAAPLPKEEERVSVAKNLALFFAAPFIGLAYIVAFPFVGIYAMVRWSMRTAKKQ